MPAKLVDLGKKISETEITYDIRGANSQVIREMDLSGWREKVLFGQNKTDTRSTK